VRDGHAFEPVDELAGHDGIIASGCGHAHKDVEEKGDEGVAEEGGEEGPMSVHPVPGCHVGESHVEGSNGHLDDADRDEEVDLGDGREPVKDVEFVVSRRLHQKMECGRASGLDVRNVVHMLATTSVVDHSDLKRWIGDCEKLYELTRYVSLPLNCILPLQEQ